MIPLAQLRRSVRDALGYLRGQPDVTEAEVFAADNNNLTVRLNYTSHIPSNGVEEPKSLEAFGLGVRVALATPQGTKSGFGSETADLSLGGVQRALEKARKGAVLDQEFISLPTPALHGPTLRGYHDPALMRATGNGLVKLGWRTLEGALDVFNSSEELLDLAGSPEQLPRQGLILGGDVMILQERMAIGSFHFHRVQTDESTILRSFATAMVERQEAKGTGFYISGCMDAAATAAGAEAARNAIGGMGGVRVPTGVYNVVLGPQAVAEILEWVLLPGLELSSFYAGVSPFMGKMGALIASPLLHLYDDGSLPGLAASKAITDEGLPTGRTQLIENGELKGLLSNYYECQRMLRDPAGERKLGAPPERVKEAIAPRNGFRTGGGGGRNFDAPPGTTPTNLFLSTGEGKTTQELLEAVGDGLYIGRLWYTYPVNGITAGDFSGTVVADSFVIKGGRLAAPLRPNAVRLNDNVLSLIRNVLAIGKEPRGTVRWDSDQVTWAPEVAVKGLRVEEIGGSMEGVYASQRGG